MKIARLGGLVGGWAIPLISVIGTGLLGAVCIALMTSGKISFVSADAAARFAVFIAFQVLGVTIVKAGLDSYIFARAALDQVSALYNLRLIFRTNHFFIWIAFSIGSFFILGTLLGAVTCSFTVLCDVYAAMRTAEFTAKKKFLIVFFANLVKYPLYFLLLFIAGPFFVIKYDDLLYLFLFISFLRFMVLFWVSTRFTFQLLPACGFGLLGAQQVFNYLLFRLDQVSVPLLSRVMPVIDSTGLSDFIFLTKYPELVSYFAAALGSVVFPKLHGRWGSNSHNSRRERWLTNIGLIVFCGFGLLFYATIFRDGLDSAFIFIPLVLGACLSFEVNFVTFRMLAVNSLRHLLKGLGVGVFFGVCVAIVAGISQSIIMVYWIIPVQMVVFLMVCSRAK